MTIICGECGGKMKYVLREGEKRLQCTDCGHIQKMPEKTTQAQTAYTEFKEQVQKRYQALNDASTAITKKNSKEKDASDRS